MKNQFFVLTPYSPVSCSTKTASPCSRHSLSLFPSVYFILDATFDVKSLIALRLSRYTRSGNNRERERAKVKQPRTVEKLKVTPLDKVQLTQNRSMRRSRKRKKTRGKKRQKKVRYINSFFFFFGTFSIFLCVRPLYIFLPSIFTLLLR